MLHSVHCSQDGLKPHPSIPKVELVSQKLELKTQKSGLNTLDERKRSLTGVLLALKSSEKCF